MSKSNSSGLQSKSPAEFFAEHQNIAGFDNPGKSQFTTLREFIENGLDASEQIGVQPQVDVVMEKQTMEEFNELRGITSRKRKDMDQYKSEGSALKRGKSGDGSSFELKLENNTTSNTDHHMSGYQGYYRITCRDNGVGMPHSKLPHMLGVVLSSTKYGQRQTRGKFGLGAKMALVWSKKSTGLPIEVRSSQDKYSGVMTYCKLDQNIQKNTPTILEHEWVPKESHVGITGGYSQWQGTEISVVVGGSWSGYQAKFLQYLRQLAVITPYATLGFQLQDHTDKKKCLKQQFNRRSEVTPKPPQEVKYHPSAVDNQLLERQISTSSVSSQRSFLTREQTDITPALSSRIIGELGEGFTSDTDIHTLSKAQIHDLVSLLKAMKFNPPNSSCLSPLGEYSLRLGVLKEYAPTVIATTTQPAGVAEGHVFVIECAVAMGGKLSPGLSVYRFANRIPLLFEGGNDISSVVATKKIKWGTYKVKQADSVGVFLSIVSTKIPFKGTGKEYIGDDKGVLHEAITAAIRTCCIQLKRRIVTEQHGKDLKDKKKKMLKFVTNVAQTLTSSMDMFKTVGLVGKESLAPGLKTFAEQEVPTWQKELGQAKLEAHLRDYVSRIEEEEHVENIKKTTFHVGNEVGKQPKQTVFHSDFMLELY